ncbi:50S ribosomal protein L3 [archaeon]|jgi:large subunit ribosomal protein L3|nr:50S ribosomal protein L3 [archaeon]MBT4242133.1 50S ribosomal protein L3 [archaeon]MBT4417821.1 50S ribosomal protein L3 [archaeon]
MPKRSTPRAGSLQFYPRVRAKKSLPRASWSSLSKDETNLLGFICYKVGMKSAYVKDNGAHSLTKGKRVTIPVTILECPSMKILSVRFYKENKLIGEVLNQNLDKELKRKLKLPNEKGTTSKDVVNRKFEDFKEDDYDKIRLIMYSQVKKTNIKKRPDISEIGLSGSKAEQLEFVKNNISKEISIKDVFNKGLVDVRGITTGKGNQGPAKRFGLRLRSHKSEKGVRGPGSGGPWHPARVEFTQPMAGQMGYFNRVSLNKVILLSENIKDKDINQKQGFKKYGEIKSDYIILTGSVQGPSKRQLLITAPYRESKNQLKKNYEFIEIR